MRNIHLQVRLTILSMSYKHPMETLKASLYVKSILLNMTVSFFNKTLAVYQRGRESLMLKVFHISLLMCVAPTSKEWK